MWQNQDLNPGLSGSIPKALSIPSAVIPPCVTPNQAPAPCPPLLAHLAGMQDNDARVLIVLFLPLLLGVDALELQLGNMGRERKLSSELPWRLTLPWAAGSPPQCLFQEAFLDAHSQKRFLTLQAHTKLCLPKVGGSALLPTPDDSSVSCPELCVCPEPPPRAQLLGGS